ncbi:unnamed protein product [Brachionus calyciflorus]|uniref:Uncharacterized protein n=1 Tax=Brachionus calyciflorus TaxID=104777 RepID=A0A813TKC1_9BILA|nr:unnamed protein product [Brachionus calyciflorus]
MNLFILILTKLILIVNLVHSNPYKLNVPKVLLPFHSSKIVSFTLEAKSELTPDTDDLCFVWSTSRPDVVSITPIYDNQTTKFNGFECSNRALVSAISKHSQRLTSIIFAKEIKTDKLIRCDVIVDQIKSIRIKHTTINLYLEDSPESFTAEALDSESNTFTSLEGLPFEWKVINDETNDDSRNVLRISKFIDSEYEVSESIRNLESIGLNGHKILIEGLKTGTAIVQAKLIDPFYKDTLKTPPVRLLVVANILIEPSYPVYLLRGTSIKYNVFLIKQTSVEKISLPSQQYFFDTRNLTVAYFDANTGSQLIARNLGQTEIILIDRNMNEEIFKDQKIALPPPSALVYVVQAEYLSFSIKNWRSWILETGRQYEIQITLFTKQKEIIYPSDNLRIESEFPKFSIRDKTQNGSYVLAKTLEKGVTFLKGFLIGDEKIRGEQEVEILDPITVKPETLIFAYTPNSEVYEHLLDVEGGSGTYYYQTKNISLAKITSNGLVQVNSNKIGQTKILVTDQRNFDINAESKILVLEPNELYIEPCPVETHVKTKLDLNIKMNGLDETNSLRRITDCSKIKFTVLIENEEIFKYVKVTTPEKDSESCARLILDAEKVGRTNIKIIYDKLTSQELQISSFSQLKSPKKNLLLTKQSSFLINLFDGPLVSELQTYVSDFELTNDNVIKVENLEHDSIGGKYSYKVTCLDKIDAETNIKFYVSNKPSFMNKCPLKFEYNLPVQCSKPTHLDLFQLFVNNDESEQSLYTGLKWQCPIKLSSKLLIANPNRDLNVQIIVRDRHNRVFDNFTSLKLDWKIDNHYLQKPHTEPHYLSLRALNENTLIKSEGYNTIFYQTFKTRRKIGECDLSVKFLIEDHSHIENSLNVKFINDVKIEPEQLVIFNHPSNLQQLKLIDGSGYFHAEVESKESNVLKITQVTDTSVQITPLINNGLCSVNIYDYCIPPESMSLENQELIWLPSARTQIKVAGINSIMVNYDDDKVQEGKRIKIYVQIVDATGNFIQSKYFKLMNLEPRIHGDNNLVKLEISDDDTGSENTGVYVLNGLRSGFIHIEFEATSDSKIIKSSKKEIEVFSPLKIEPKLVELILGSEYQIQYSGGPVLTPEMIIKFDVEDHADFINISDTGLVLTQKLGLVRINVKILNSKKLYTKDSVDLKIVELNFIKLNSPLSSIKLGNKFNVHVFVNNLNPFHFATSKNLRYKWTFNDDSQCDILRDNKFSLHLKTKRLGVLKISVQVSNGKKIFSDSLEITVFPPLVLENFESKLSSKNVILSTSKTSVQLRTNYDMLNSEINYSLRFYTQDLECSNSSIQISSNTIQIGDIKLAECLVGLLITAKIESKIETLFYLIKVKPILYTMFELDGNRVSVSYHDNLGDEFYVVNTKNSLRINRNDLVDFISLNRQVFGSGLLGVSFLSRSEENSFSIKVLRKGFFIMELTSGNQNSDFFAQDLSYLEMERKELAIGDIICNLTQDATGSVSVFKSANGLIGLANSQGLIQLGKNKEFLVRGIDTVKILGKHQFVTNAKNIEEFDYGGNSFEFIINDHRQDVECSSDFEQVFISSQSPFKCQVGKHQFLTNTKNIEEFEYGGNSFEFIINDHRQDAECSSDFEQVFTSSQSPFKCQIGLYNSNDQKLNYMDRLIKTEVKYHNKNWLCEIKFIQNSEQIIYDLMSHHIDQTKGKSSYLEQEPTKVKIFIDSKNSLNYLEDQSQSSKITTFDFIPDFYIQTKLIELTTIKNSHFNLVIKTVCRLSPNIIVNTNIPSLIKLRQIGCDDFSLVYDVEKTDAKFDLSEYANVLQVQNGNLYVEILNTQNQQVERVPVKFIFSSTTSQMLEFRKCGSLRECYSFFQFTSSNLTNFLIFLTIFLIFVIVILKLKTPQTRLVPTTEVKSPRQKQTTPRAADSGSFNSFKYFSPSAESAVFSPSSRTPPFQVKKSPSHDQIAPGGFGRQTENVNLFSVNDNVLNTSANVYDSSYLRPRARRGCSSDDE